MPPQAYSGQLQNQSSIHSRYRTPHTGAALIETSLLNWLELHPQQALALVPLFAFAEACVGIGLFVSGLFLVTVASWLFTTESASLMQIIPLSLLGALLGDHAGFYLGRWIGPGLHHISFMKKRSSALQRIEQLLIKYGSLTIFIGRFTPAIRSLVPALLGVSNFSRWRFLWLDLIACTLWSCALALILVGVEAVF